MVSEAFPLLLNETIKIPILTFVFMLLIALFEEKAILLSRMGQHEQALNAYVYKLRNYQMAEELVTGIFAISCRFTFAFINLYTVFSSVPNTNLIISYPDTVTASSAMTRNEVGPCISRFCASTSDQV